MKNGWAQRFDKRPNIHVNSIWLPDTYGVHKHIIIVAYVQNTDEWIGRPTISVVDKSFDGHWTMIANAWTFKHSKANIIHLNLKWLNFIAEAS